LLIILTTDCIATSFAPATTSDFPLLAHNSAAILEICSSYGVVATLPTGEPASLLIAKYKLYATAPSSEGFI